MNLKELSKKIRTIDIFTNKGVTELFAGNYKSSFKGQGLEVKDIRKYEEGDDIRHIDWIITAKQGFPYVKEYQESRELSTIVMVDISASMNFTSSEKTKKEVALEVAAIILFSALKNGDKFGAIIFSDKIEKYIPIKKGKSHLLLILREIIVCFENNKYKSSDHEAALKFLNMIVKKHAICFFISDEISENQSHSLRIANKKHDFVFLRTFDSFEEGFTSEEVLKIEDPESGEQIVLDLSNPQTKQNFLKLRQDKMRQMQEVLKKNKIEALHLSTTCNIFQKLLIFFKKRQLQ